MFNVESISHAHANLKSLKVLFDKSLQWEHRNFTLESNRASLRELLLQQNEVESVPTELLNAIEEGNIITSGMSSSNNDANGRDCYLINVCLKDWFSITIEARYRNYNGWERTSLEYLIESDALYKPYIENIIEELVDNTVFDNSYSLVETPMQLNPSEETLLLQLLPVLCNEQIALCLKPQSTVVATRPTDSTLEELRFFMVKTTTIDGEITHTDTSLIASKNANDAKIHAIRVIARGELDWTEAYAAIEKSGYPAYRTLEAKEVPLHEVAVLKKHHQVCIADDQQTGLNTN
ncbi:hypothetical protein L1D14_22985 [Vibrio tubiashii]|uniref:hypothetical protein n=1 Tax=Vibrio tubiashii TaxID=29498 RepID=UPI001EFDE533|nr:hypothetical protein [Vibrio tubiashii]MCG9579070.1 hypothetical protein [Vibrio tubiashii]